MMGKMKKAGVSLSPSHRAPRAYFSFSPAFLRHKQASERNSMFAGKSSLTCIKK